MRKKDYTGCRFVSPREAANQTGIGAKAIRQGCIDKRIPHIKIGSDYRIDMPAYLEMLGQQSRSNVADQQCLESMEKSKKRKKVTP